MKNLKKTIFFAVFIFLLAVLASFAYQSFNLYSIRKTLSCGSHAACIGFPVSDTCYGFEAQVIEVECTTIK